ncbi:hypothetical protein BurJ1DRAFT_3551 [Burkholderiales bacterium JOSHI_001]|nr:hypothetical protein BurJ1DRAFT_3551 [Burkholderiales bacterium JOSHI_001]
MPKLCAALRRPSRPLRISPDQVLAVLLLVLLVVVMGRQWPALTHAGATGPGVQQATLDEDCFFED